MTSNDLARIIAMKNAAIIAPAGHGKTEIISKLVNISPNKILVLTHTNAGVDAIKKRMAKNNVPNEKYFATTIASFCTSWCLSYSNTANFDLSLSPIVGDNKKYYNQLYVGSVNIFQNSWAGNILKNSYHALIVDEYQDCLVTQHNVVLEISKYLKTWILGDPLQGIFGWAGPLVDWKSIQFPIIDIPTSPWRWVNTNMDLGNWINKVREQIYPILDKVPVSVKVENIVNTVRILPPAQNLVYAILPEIREYRSVVYLTKWPNKQLSFANEMGGLFQNDETQDCALIHETSSSIDNAIGTKLGTVILNLMKECATHVGTETISYRHRLESGSLDFSRISKYPELGALLSNLCKSNETHFIIEIINWFEKNNDFKIFRKEVLDEMKRIIQFSKEKNIGLEMSAIHIRRDINLQKQYSNFKYLSSRTVLSKGLEFECVIIDMVEQLSARDFYVAITRATKMVYIITDQSNLFFTT